MRVVAGFRDHRSAVGMADEDRRAVLEGEHVVGGFNVTLERQRLVLHDAHVEAVRREQVVHPPPPGSVHEPSVAEDDVLYIGHGCLLWFVALG